MLNAPFARSMAPVTAFKGERVRSWRLGRREFASVSKTTEMTAKNGVARRVRERTQIQVPVGDHPVITCLRQRDPFGEEDSFAVDAFQDACDRLIRLLWILRCLTCHQHYILRPHLLFKIPRRNAPASWTSTWCCFPISFNSRDCLAHCSVGGTPLKFSSAK